MADPTTTNSTTTKSTKTSTTYDPQEYLDYINSTSEASKKNVEQDVANNVSEIKSQEADVTSAYDKLRADATSTVRKNAVNTNELLANSGLAGGLNQAPTSGISETSRIAQDTSLKNVLSEYNTSEQEAINSLYAAINATTLAGQNSLDTIDLETASNIQAAKLQNTELLDAKRTEIQSYVADGITPPEDLQALYENLSGETYMEALERLNPTAYKLQNAIVDASDSVKNIVNIGIQNGWGVNDFKTNLTENYAAGTITLADTVDALKAVGIDKELMEVYFDDLNARLNSKPSTATATEINAYSGNSGKQRLLDFGNAFGIPINVGFIGGEDDPFKFSTDIGTDDTNYKISYSSKPSESFEFTKGGMNKDIDITLPDGETYKVELGNSNLSAYSPTIKEENTWRESNKEILDKKAIGTIWKDTIGNREFYLIKTYSTNDDGYKIYPLENSSIGNKGLERIVTKFKI